MAATLSTHNALITPPPTLPSASAVLGRRDQLTINEGLCGWIWGTQGKLGPGAVSFGRVFFSCSPLSRVLAHLFRLRDLFLQFAALATGVCIRRGRGGLHDGLCRVNEPLSMRRVLLGRQKYFEMVSYTAARFPFCDN